MESKKINQLATELTPSLSDLTIIGDPSTGISKKITLSQMASLFTGTVEEYANLAAFPLVGVADTIYIALDTNVLYRWNTGTNAYVELSPNIINSLVFNDANGFDGTISLVGSVATLTITTALTTGSVGFIGASGALLQDNANFFWDDTNNRLGIGTNAPTTAIDVFGSGIIGRLNGTSTNNAFLGFASAGSNKWSIGNVQSDHRFRIYNEATTSELVSVLSTGEFGIGIANPTTKFHIDGAASALIANLDANVSVAKSISFRSDNSNRINLEVSGTESGSNAGANFFIRRYSDAGALIDTPLTITRSTGLITLATALSGTSVSLSSDLQFYNAGVSTGMIQADANDFYVGGQTGKGLKLCSNNLGNPRMYINVAGNVGINTLNPSTFLHVLGSNTSGRGQLSIQSNNASNAAKATWYYDTFNSGEIGSTGSDFYALATNSFIFFAGGNQRMTILGSGNIGIGTSTPNQLLQISKAGTVALALTNTSSGADAYIQYDVVGSSFSIGVNSTGWFSYTSAAKTYDWWNGNAIRMKFNTNNNLLIGTETDNGSRLNVNGNATFSSVVIANRFSSNEFSQNISSSATSIFDSGGGSGVWLITVVVTGNPGQIGYAIVGQRFGSTLTLLSSGVGSQIAFSISGNNLQLSQSAGGTISTSISVMRINQGG